MSSDSLGGIASSSAADPFQYNGVAVSLCGSHIAVSRWRADPCASSATSLPHSAPPTPFISVYCAQDGALEQSFGVSRRLPGQFGPGGPTRLCFTYTGNLLVTERCPTSARVQELTLTGGFVRSIGVGSVESGVHGIAASAEVIAVGLWDPSSEATQNLPMERPSRILLFDAATGVLQRAVCVEGMGGFCHALRFVPASGWPQAGAIAIAHSDNSLTSSGGVTVVPLTALAVYDAASAGAPQAVVQSVDVAAGVFTDFEPVGAGGAVIVGCCYGAGDQHVAVVKASDGSEIRRWGGTPRRQYEIQANTARYEYDFLAIHQRSERAFDIRVDTDGATYSITYETERLASDASEELPFFSPTPLGVAAVNALAVPVPVLVTACPPDGVQSPWALAESRGKLYVLDRKQPWLYVYA